MNDDRLEQLLMDADEAAPPPQLALDLSRRVRSRLRRRQLSIRMGMAAVAVVFTAAVLSQHKARSSRTIVRSPHPSDAMPLDELRAEAVQLASDATVHERVADALLRAREQSLHRHKWGEALAATSEDPGRVIQEARDRAAEILVRDADRMPADSLHALQEYRYVARLFPNTPAAKQAMLKLKSEGV